MQLEDGDLYVVIGSTRSGKSTWTWNQVKDRPRLLVWDPKSEYGGRGLVDVSTLDELRQLVRQRSPQLRIRWAVSGDVELRAQFEWICVAVLAWASISRPVCFLAEELADVSPPGKATGAWGTVLRQGRGRGITTYGLTQRPTESDKTIVGNANVLHVCRLQRARDRQLMAAELDLPLEQLDLACTATYGDFIERRAGEAPTKGRLTFKSGRVAALKL